MKGSVFVSLFLLMTSSLLAHEPPLPVIAKHRNVDREIAMQLEFEPVNQSSTTLPVRSGSEHHMAKALLAARTRCTSVDA